MRLATYILAVLGIIWIAGTSAVGNIEIWNKIQLGLVLRPMIVEVSDPENIGQPDRATVENEGKIAQGITPGRRHK